MIFYGVATERSQQKLMTNFNSNPFENAAGPAPKSRATQGRRSLYETGEETESVRQSRPNRGGTRIPETRSTKESRNTEQADEIMRNLGLAVALPKGAVRMAHLLEVQRFARETENGYKILANLGSPGSWRGPCPD